MLENKNKIFKRGDAILVDFGNRIGSVEYGIRPAIIVGNSTSNLHSPAISVVPLTTSIAKFRKQLPTHVIFTPMNSGIRKDSIAMCEAVTTIDKDWIVKNEPLFTITDDLMRQIDIGLLIQFFGKNMVRNQMAYAM